MKRAVPVAVGAGCHEPAEVNGDNLGGGGGIAKQKKNGEKVCLEQSALKDGKPPFRTGGRTGFFSESEDPVSAVTMKNFEVVS